MKNIVSEYFGNYHHIKKPSIIRDDFMQRCGGVRRRCGTPLDRVSPRLRPYCFYNNIEILQCAVQKGGYEHISPNKKTVGVGRGAKNEPAHLYTSTPRRTHPPHIAVQIFIRLRGTLNHETPRPKNYPLKKIAHFRCVIYPPWQVPSVNDRNFDAPY